MEVKKDIYLKYSRSLTVSLDDNVLWLKSRENYNNSIQAGILRNSEKNEDLDTPPDKNPQQSEELAESKGNMEWVVEECTSYNHSDQFQKWRQ